MTPLLLHPVDYFNFHGNFKDIFRYEKEDVCKVISEKEVACIDPNDLPSGLLHTTYKLTNENQVSVLRGNGHNIEKGSIVSKFYVLTQVRFKGDYKAAESHILYKIMQLDVPYVRIGTDYFKIIENKNRWGGISNELKTWDKTTITEDHGKSTLKLIPKYDDFCIVPDNLSHSTVHENRYNLYVPFAHEPHPQPVTPDMIPTSMKVMLHIFGSNDKLAQGWTYMKCLYEHPRQMLPILVLLSEKQGTGKTTFLDWIYMIFGDNSTVVNPESISSEFNASYATKNILMFEEAFFSKQEANEKIKRLTTGKIIQIRNLYQAAYTIPLYCKLIMCSNKIYDFMRIESEETRYFPLEIKPVTGELNTKIDEELFKEIPMFLRYLSQLPAIDFSKNRLVLTAEDIRTSQLVAIKKESRSGLYKEIELHVQDFFDNNPGVDSFLAAAIDIKEEFFARDNQIKAHYVSKVLKQEMKMTVEENQRYYPFDRVSIGKERVSTPFKFKRLTETIPARQTSTEISSTKSDELEL